jgi:PPP family 3-phenylpropionic acid transporter
MQIKFRRLAQMSRLTALFKNSNSNILKLSSINFLYWSTFSAFYPFLAIYLSNKGFSNTKTGMVLAVNSFIAVLAQPFWGFMSDWLRSVRRVFLICLVCASMLWLSLSSVDSLILIPVIFIFLTFFESPMAPLSDNWIVQGVRNENVDFGRIRFLGSVGFGIMVYFNGLLVEKYGFSSVYYSYTVFAIITFIAIFRNKTSGNPPVIQIKNLKIGKLFKNYYYITFLIFSTILFIPHKSAYTYLPKLMDMVGGTKENYGMAVSVIALSEIPFFLFSGYLLRRFKPIYLILTSSVFFIIRQIMYLLSPSPLYVILASILQGPSYALFLAGTMYYIDAQTPEELKFTAQLLGSAVFSGVSGIVGNFAGGVIIDQFGLRIFYQAGILVSVVVSLLFIMSLPLGKKITGRSALSIE